MYRVRGYLTYANVMSTIAVFAALVGGTAWAASKVGTGGIKNGAVTSKKIRDGAVTTNKLHGGAVSTKKIADGAVSTGKLRDGAVTATKVAEGAVTTEMIGNGAVTTEKLRGDAVAPKAEIGMSPVAYGSVGPLGTVDPAFSRGLSNANIVTNPPGSDPGTYCIKGLTGVKTAMVVADTQGGNNHATIRLGEGALEPVYCGAVPGTQFAVSTFDLVGPADKGFYIWFFN